MKKTLLTGIAALLLWQEAAHANDKLPEAMIGRWCLEDSPVGLDTYKRGKCEFERLEVIMRQEGFEEIDNKCVFRTIKRTSEEIYLVRLYCDVKEEYRGKYAPKEEGNEHYYEATKEFEIIDGLLHMRGLSEQ